MTCYTYIIFHYQTIEQLVEDREHLDQQLRQLQMTRSSNYFPAPGRGGMRQSQSSNRPGRGYSNVGDRGATANGPSQKGDENGDPHSDEESSQEEESAFSREEDNDEEDEEEEEGEEEEKTIEAPITITTQSNATRGRFRGRGGQRGRFRGRGYRNTSGNNNRFNRGGGRGNYRGPQGRNARQSYPSPSNTRPNQSDRKAERVQDTTVESSQVDNHEGELEQEASQSVSIPKDQRPPRERRTVPQDASPTNEQQNNSPPLKDQPSSVDEGD